MGEALSLEMQTTGYSGDIAVIRAEGVIDSNTSGKLEQIISEILLKKIFKLIIDLEKTSYISSAGWGIFVGEIRSVRNHRGDIKLVNMTNDVENIYRLLEFSSIIKAFPNVDAAIHDFYSAT